MPKNRPTIGQTNWGTPLNDHINQLSPNGGGINFSGSAPTGLVATDDGYTYVNTTTREIQRWNGTGWDVLLGGVAIGRETLTANRTYYVNNISGSDTNDGLTAGTAFGTIQKAVDLIKNTIEPGSFTSTIQVADSATPYAGAVCIDVRKVIIQGNDTDPNLVKIDTITVYSGTGIGFQVDENSNIIVSGFSFVALSNTTLPIRFLQVTRSSNLTVKKVKFGDIPLSSPQRMHAAAELTSFISFETDYEIAGGAQYHIFCSTGSYVRHLVVTGNITVTLTATPGFTTFIVVILQSRYVRSNGITFIGSATGQTYSVTQQSIIVALPGVFPGSTSGNSDASSFYQ